MGPSQLEEVPDPLFTLFLCPKCGNNNDTNMTWKGDILYCDKCGEPCYDLEEAERYLDSADWRSVDTG